MSLSELFDRWLSAHDAAGTPMSSCLRPPIDDQALARVGASLGMLPADVVALHRIADGVDLELWNEEALVPPRLAPGGPEFIDLARSAAVAVGMRDAAVASSRTMGTEPDSLWPPHLGLAYPMWPDDCIAVDTQLSVGELWVVRWEAVDIRPLQHDLAWVFQRATEDLERLECVWDPDERILRFNEDLADELPPFPN